MTPISQTMYSAICADRRNPDVQWISVSVLAADPEDVRANCRASYPAGGDTLVLRISKIEMKEITAA